MCKMVKYFLFLFFFVSTFFVMNSFASSSAHPHIFQDIGVSAIAAEPIHSEKETKHTEMTLNLEITNYGSLDLPSQTVIPVGVDFDDIATVFEFFTLTSDLPAGSKITFSLQTPFDFSTQSTYQMAAYTLLPGDNAFQHKNGFNDTLHVKLNIDKSVEDFAGDAENSKQESFITDQEGGSENPFVLSLFPNPATNYISLAINQDRNIGKNTLAYEITDLTGEKVAKGSIDAHQSLHRIYLEDLPGGIYLLRVFDGIEKQTLKFQSFQP